MSSTALVVTSIAAPNKCLQALAEGCRREGYNFIVIGDAASPSDFQLDGCNFYSLNDQLRLGFKFAHECPERHYARKNLGYLIALRDGAHRIVETDDDNLPYPAFWTISADGSPAPTVSGAGWINIFRYFSSANIWPRGFPLELVRQLPPDFESLGSAVNDCPISHGLIDNDPDVDAIYRLTGNLPQMFTNNRRVALREGSWCPFGSQNTTWSAKTFALLYLPAYCSFRMTDIWRSFIAQRIAWANNWSVLFHEPTMYQERNTHNLMKDFRDEVPGYLHNAQLCSALEKLDLPAGEEQIPQNLRTCYRQLVAMDLIDPKELNLLDTWLDDLNSLRTGFDPT